MRRDIQKAVILRKPEILRLGDSKLFSGNTNPPKNAGAPPAPEISIVPKQRTKTGGAKNKSAADCCAGPATAAAKPDSTSDQFEFESEITDRALDEIGERMAIFEKRDKNDDDVLALADGETCREDAKDFMEQKLKTLLTKNGGEAKSSSPQIESSASENVGEVIDHFDSEAVLRSRETGNSNGEALKTREVTLIASVALTASEAALEKTRTGQTFEPQDEFYNALVHRVL